MSQSLTLRYEQEQEQQDAKDDLDWLNDELLAGVGESIVENIDIDELALDADLKEEAITQDEVCDSKVQPRQEQEKIAVQDSKGEGGFELEEEGEKLEENNNSPEEDHDLEENGHSPEGNDRSLEKNDHNLLETLSKTSDIPPEFEAEIVTGSAQADVVTIIDDEPNDVEIIEDEVAHNLSGNDNGEIDDDYENESGNSSEEETSRGVSTNLRTGRCILEYGEIKRSVSIRPEIRLYDFMRYLKNDLASQEGQIQEVVLTFRDSINQDFVFIISQENYYAQQYSLRDMLELHYSFQRSLHLSSDLRIIMTLNDGFYSQLNRVKFLIAEAARGDTGNSDKNPIILDDSNPGSPNSQNVDEENNVIVIASPKESIKQPQLEVANADLAPYSGDEENDQPEEEAWANNQEGLSDLQQSSKDVSTDQKSPLEATDGDALPDFEELENTPLPNEDGNGNSTFQGDWTPSDDLLTDDLNAVENDFDPILGKRERDDELDDLDTKKVRIS